MSYIIHNSERKFFFLAKLRKKVEFDWIYMVALNVDTGMHTNLITVPSHVRNLKLKKLYGIVDPTLISATCQI